MPEFYEMKVAGIALDPSNNAPIVILRDIDGTFILPIWIGIMEASAIAAALEGVVYSRPMTHDLFRSFVEHLGVVVEKIEVVDLKDNVFYALITVIKGDERLQIDARPSDAIAIALRTNSPIYVAEHVVKDAIRVDTAKPAAGKIMVGFEQDQEKLKEILEKMNPEDFGKFKA
ncbi:MAG TPA: bifunctional nuclease family protein [Deltaproteobacteria bacterium]|nr:bifunctional nuclease family protein [Deltaproteobacteria bacterium]HOM28308.1 bifunctional nuclease family protein [Deltaproteobacteria bacterium]HPP79405.1 bifunctional nuclease family protein [Deltaproteobacteria bacterium]